MGFEFKKASKKSARLRAALIGPAGSGKTYSALAIATHLGGRVAVIDTEHGSASKYAGLFTFDALELETFGPRTYVEALQAAQDARYDVVVVDSLSHAWMGKDGALEQVDRAAKRSSSGNTFGAWRDVTPQHNALVEAMLACRAHLIVTMRVKMDYSQERDERTGRTVVRKIGLAPVQRDGLEYEFDVVGDVTADHEMVITKTRCPELTDKVFARPGADVAAILRGWLSDGVPVVAAPRPPAAPDPFDRFRDELASAETYEAVLRVYRDNHAAIVGGAGPAVDAQSPELAAALDLCFARLEGDLGMAGARVRLRADTGADEAQRAAAKREAYAQKQAPVADVIHAAASQRHLAADEDRPDVRAAMAATGTAATPASEPVAAAKLAELPPALSKFTDDVAAMELPGEAVNLWIKNRPEFATLSTADREAAWKELCKRTEEVGGMKNAKAWLKKAIAVEDARRAQPERDDGPKDTPPTGSDAPAAHDATRAEGGGNEAAAQEAPAAKADYERALVRDDAAWRKHLEPKADVFEIAGALKKRVKAFRIACVDKQRTTAAAERLMALCKVDDETARKWLENPGASWMPRAAVGQ